jgi:uncharacterized membrane protein
MGTDLRLVLLSTFVTLAFIYTPVLNHTVLKFAFGLAMLFFIPGYVFAAALYPKNSDMEAIERTALSFGLSICIFPVIGLILTYTRWALRFEPLVVCLTVFTVTLALVASARRFRLPEEDRYFVDFRKALKEISGVVFARRSGFDTALTVLLVLTVVLAVIGIGYAAIVPQQRETFTEFYVLGPNNTANGYPTSFNYTDTKGVIVGIANHEYRDVTYNLVISLHNSTTDKVLYLETVPVADGQRWEKPVNLTPGQNGMGMRLDFQLYADRDTTRPYRECHFGVDVVNST